MSVNGFRHLDGNDVTRFYYRYGLLGASGCGKTTVLSCIVGRRTLDDGKITVFGGTPGDRQSGIPGKRVGYMPQVSFDLLCRQLGLRRNALINTDQFRLERSDRLEMNLLFVICNHPFFRSIGKWRL